MRLRNEGARANTLNAQGHSPVDVLDNLRDIDEPNRSRLRMALLQSLNPTAPLGYAKPEALHGTPWGLEILQSGVLKGGVNDPKGGSQSLEGKVFFSDRTPENTADQTTRLDLRSKPRTYSEGKGIRTSNAYSRALQHRLSQVILHALDSGKALPSSTKTASMDVANPAQLEIESAAWLQQFLQDSYINNTGGRKFIGAQLGEHLDTLKLPGALALNDGGQQIELRGDDLNRFYHQAATELQRTLEDGKAPYLSVLNKGGIVPLVFGFEKINNLSTHAINYPSKTKQYSYQDTDHPLAGTPENGGKLKEVEVRSLGDFATLTLGCAIKNVVWPADVLVRVKGRNGEKAHYLDAHKVEVTRHKLAAQIAELAGGEPLGTLGIHRLQDINSRIRANDSVV